MGEWMYGVDSCVHPAYQGKGVGSLLMNARFDVLRKLNLRGLVAGSLIMGYSKVAAELTPEAYVAEVVAGTRFDNNLTKQLKKGFRVLNVIPEYVYDPRSLNYGVAMVWENPDYDPAVGALPSSVLQTNPIRRTDTLPSVPPYVPPAAATGTGLFPAVSP